VTLVLKDGRVLASGRVGGSLSFPQTGWDEATMEEKFRWLVEPVLGQDRLERLISLVWRFDEVKDVGELIELVRETNHGAAE
jgi:hypothetical protein